MNIRDILNIIKKNDDVPDLTKVDDIHENSENEDEEVQEDVRTPSPPSVKRPADRYQSKPEKRTKYQNGNDSRWQTPQGNGKPNSAKRPNSSQK